MELYLPVFRVKISRNKFLYKHKKNTYMIIKYFRCSYEWKSKSISYQMLRSATKFWYQMPIAAAASNALKLKGNKKGGDGSKV